MSDKKAVSLSELPAIFDKIKQYIGNNSTSKYNYNRSDAKVLDIPSSDISSMGVFDIDYDNSYVLETAPSNVVVGGGFSVVNTSSSTNYSADPLAISPAGIIEYEDDSLNLGLNRQQITIIDDMVFITTGSLPIQMKPKAALNNARFFMVRLPFKWLLPKENSYAMQIFRPDIRMINYPNLYSSGYAIAQRIPCSYETRIGQGALTGNKKMFVDIFGMFPNAVNLTTAFTLSVPLPYISFKKDLYIISEDAPNTIKEFFN